MEHTMLQHYDSPIVTDRGRLVPYKDEHGYFIGNGCSSFTRKVHLVNPGERDYFDHRYILWFGAHSATYLAVWADSLDDALEEAGSWLVEHAPGLIMQHDSEELENLVREACKEAGLDYPPSDPGSAWESAEYQAAQDAAVTDLTDTERGYITSYEWGIALEDWSRDALVAFVSGGDKQ